MRELYYKFLHLYSGSYTHRIISETLDLLAQLCPYVVIGIVLTVLVKLYVSKQWLASFFKQNQKVSILLAALIGILSPLGSYVIIPLGAALFAVGLPLPALMALLMASPLINPNLFFLTSGAFGYQMAIVRTLSAFILGVSSGYLTLFALKKQWITQPEVLKTAGQNLANFEEETGRSPWNEFWHDMYRMSRYVARFFFWAILLAAIIKITVAPNFIIKFFGGDTFLSVLLTTGAGVPFYVCGGAAIPVMQQLADLGMNKGAVLAFFISGPATKMSNLVLMQGIFNKKIFGIYLLVGIMGAFLLGLMYSLI